MEGTTEGVPAKSSDNVSPVNSPEERTPTPPPQDPTKKSKKEDRSKKDDKNIEQFMKSLSSVPTVDEKLGLVCKKYVQMTDDNKKLQFYIKQSDKRHALLVKEKEQLQHEYNKTILVKSKLENLCRELQKQNKAIKEESLLKIREEEERRKETQTKFQNTLSEITSLLQQNNEKNAKLRDDNISMTEKFKSVVQQYQLREQQVDKMAKQMALESQLSDAKLQKASLEHQAEKERLLAELETLKVTVAQCRAKNMELQGNESALKGQLAVYTDKYDEFQTALVRSNQVFGGFKEQMEKMSKKIQKLEKESLSWKKRWETSQSALLDMCGERQASEERAAAAGRHLQQMQSLCRTLQAERTVLLNSLKEHNIERPPLPTPPPAPTPVPTPMHTPASNAKVDAMAANCVQLRQSLAHLQSQLNVLTNKKEESPKPEKQKKSKSKKNKQDKAQKVAIEKVDTKNSEADINVKDSSEENQPNIDEAKDQNEESKEDKIDSITMESLIQAINMANINLSDLGENDDQNNETEKLDVVEEFIKEDTDSHKNVVNDTAKGDSTEGTETKMEIPLTEKVNSELDITTNDQQDVTSKHNPVEEVKDKTKEVVTETDPEKKYEKEINQIDLASSPEESRLILKETDKKDDLTEKGKANKELDVNHIEVASSPDKVKIKSKETDKKYDLTEKDQVKNEQEVNHIEVASSPNVIKLISKETDKKDDLTEKDNVKNEQEVKYIEVASSPNEVKIISKETDKKVDIDISNTESSINIIEVTEKVEEKSNGAQV